MSDAINYLSEFGILLQPGADRLIEEHDSPEAAARFVKEHYTDNDEPVLEFPSSQDITDILKGMTLTQPVVERPVDGREKEPYNPDSILHSTPEITPDGTPGSTPESVPDSIPANTPERVAASASVARAVEVSSMPSTGTGLPPSHISGAPSLTPQLVVESVPSGEVVSVPSGDSAPSLVVDVCPPIPHGIIKWKPTAKEYNEDIRVDMDISGNSTCTGKLADFVSYFSSRFEMLRGILKRQHRPFLETLRTIEFVVRNEHRFRDGEVQVIGMVRKVYVTPKKNVMVDLEDDTGDMRVLIMHDIADNISQIIPDEVIAVSGRMMPRTRNYPASLMARSPVARADMPPVVRPDVPQGNRSGRAELPLYAAFMSDIHMGSNTFLEKNWERFMDWINGRKEHPMDPRGKIASGIKYLVLPGDVVDGIGIYPGQEEELEISDIYRQYGELAKRLSDIPEHIKLILSPGNHDAVRMAEPQPSFIPEVEKIFREHLPDAVLVGNPSRFRLHGVNVLSYHGKSMDDFITTMSSLTYDTPLEIMKEMLKRRHLAPIYGKRTLIAPEKKDYLVIDEVPDIFVTGHVHSAGLDRYRGVLLINASTWQNQTSYQKMMNFVPDYAKLPVVNLQTLEADILDFT